MKAQDNIIMTRSEAREKGLTRFFSGRPCIHGHLTERSTVNGTCIPCCYKSISKIGKRDRIKNRKKHTDRTREAMHKLKIENPKKYQEKLDRTKKWRDKNKAHLKEYDRKCKEKNPELKRLYENRRRAKKTGAGGHHTLQQIKEMLLKQACKCINCLANISKKYEIDHIQPISKGGSNWISNIQLLCPLCNHKKNAKDPFQWAKEQGRLL